MNKEAASVETGRAACEAGVVRQLGCELQHGGRGHNREGP